jgi:hypothetical protein
VRLEGVPVVHDRIVVGRLVVAREGGRIARDDLEGVDDLKRTIEEGRKVFLERTNTSGRAIDFGPARTNGSFKVMMREDLLELLPFPREKRFDVDLALRELAPGRNLRHVEVVGIGADGREIGNVPSRLSRARGRLRFAVGMKGAARYVIRY